MASPSSAPSPARAAAHTAPELAVRATGLALRTRRGPVYGPLDLQVEPGTLTVVQGPQGGGRSSLLLTLAGRMTPDASSRLTVLGEPLPSRRRAVQLRSAIAGFAGIDGLDDSVTVADAVRERLTWLAPWYRRVPRATQHDVDALVAPVYGDRPHPRARTVIWDLDEVDAMLLRIALAMSSRPELLVVDDVDQVHDDTRRQQVWTCLERLTATGTTVIAAAASLDEAARMSWSTAPQQICLASGPHAVPA
jgi:ABC-type multidrug transport system ATPase subunit